MEHIRRPRVGHIQFLNCLPLYHGLVRSAALLDLELRKGTPTELNRMLLDGELDVSPISSVTYLRHAHDLLVLPDIAVSADGPVRSIALVSRRPVEDLEGATLALANTSATSVALLDILLRERWRVKVETFSCPPDLARMLEEADAALLIGDDALRATVAASRGPASDPVHVYDLGLEWKAHTGLPMVFAVWAVRRDWAASHPELVRAVHEAFQFSLVHSIAEVEAIAASVARWEPFDAAFLADYFRGLRFGLGPRERDGLKAFAAHLLTAGAQGLREVPELRLAEVGGGDSSFGLSRTATPGSRGM
ncbi:MAG: menaquinone biosynthesis protein [Actinomycetota bacterium]|nr:menaquinone biosynthesis protein [Actinomycetota bacterium]